MAKVFSIVRVLTIVFFFMALLGMYYDLNLYSKGLVIYFDANQKPALSTTSNVVFWVGTGFILLLNGLAVALKNLFHALPRQALKTFTPNSDFWLKNEESRDHYYAVMDTWLMTFIGVLNMFLVFVVLKMWRMNRALKGEITEYRLLTVAAVVIIVFFISYIFVRFRIKKYDVV
ncbi:hypothetical protein [uncultured Microscilla sp.]|uniref:hypothetical protein n=1 Tax=uncultured Microscilla sp. TaxID=432653 RepID=UPI0026316350|nr:hypothetical protein [uncultured Microscilla sp.]